MFAVIKEGGKQYCVQVGSVISTERVTAEVGSEFDIESSGVLFVCDGDSAQVSDFTSCSGKVTVKVLEHKRTDKVVVFKKKRRHNYRRKHGHRQNISVVEVCSITK